MGGMATTPSSLSKAKGDGTAPSGQAGPAARASDTGAPRSFITPAFPQAEAMGPGAAFATGQVSPSLGGKREPERAGFAAKPIRGNRKRVRTLSEPNPYSYTKTMEDRSRGESLLELGRADGTGSGGKAGQPSTPGNDTNAQILEIIRRRQAEAKTQAKTVPPTTLLKQPELPELRTPDGNAPRNLLESAQALAAQRKAREAANPAAKPAGLQPAVFRPIRQQPAGLGQGNQGGIVQAQAPVPMPDLSRVPVPAPLPGQGSGAPLAGLDHLSNLMEEGLRRIAPFTSGGSLSILGLSPEGIRILQSMAPAEPLPPLPPSEAQEGGPVTYPGLDPEQGKADSAFGPLITPVPREATPPSTGGYGEEREDLPDTSILEIKPHEEDETYPQPSNDLSGKDKTGIWKKARDYAGSKLGKADLERREWAMKHNRPNSPYGALWPNLPSKKGSNIKTYGDFTFKWDYRHGGEIEVFQRGEHLGVLDPLTTEWIKHGEGKREGPKN